MIPCLAPIRGKNFPAFTITPGPLDTPCWLWNGCLNSKGYPVRGTKDGRYLVHRQALIESGTPLRDGEQAHHRCETPRCVNPGHLSAYSALDHAREHAGHLTAAERACELLATGPMSGAELALALGLNLPSLRIALYRAQGRGEVALAGGRYALVTVYERKVA